MTLLSRMLHLCLCLVFFVAHVQAQQIATPHSVGIAAIVNDSLITEADLNYRLLFVILTSGLPNTKETRENLKPQVLKAMIDERLELLEAKKYGVKIPKEEILQAVSRIEQREGMAAGALSKLMKDNNIPDYILNEQFEANIAWRTIINQLFEGSTAVSDVEIETYITQVKNNSNSENFAISEIFLPVENPKNVETIRSEGKKLVEQIRKGAHFASLARQFSKSASAAQGGNIGVILKGSLDPALEVAIQNLLPGQVSEPVRSQQGFYIYFKHLPEGQTYHLMQALLPASQQEELNTAAGYLQHIRSKVTSCSLAEKRIKADVPPARVTYAQNVSLQRLHPQLAQLLNKLKPGQLSQPIGTEEGITAFMICEIKDNKPTVPTHKEAQAVLLEQKLAMYAQRTLRDLRRASHIETRL